MSKQIYPTEPERSLLRSLKNRVLCTLSLLLMSVLFLALLLTENTSATDASTLLKSVPTTEARQATQDATWAQVDSPTNKALYDVKMVSSTDGWAVGGSNTILRWDGNVWYEVDHPFDHSPFSFLRSIGIVSANDVWFVGHWWYDDPFYPAPRLLHWNGSELTSHSIVGGGLGLRDIAMLSSTEGWVVGGRGTVGYWNGETWSYVWIPTLEHECDQATLPRPCHFSSVSMLSPAEGWIVGEYRNIWRWDGNEWTRVESTLDQELNQVRMVSSTDGWIVGEGGMIAHWNGSSWLPVDSPTIEGLWSVDMLSAADGWAVGGAGTILHWDGTSWALVDSPVTNHLYSVIMESATEGWAVGDGGVILRYGVAPPCVPIHGVQISQSPEGDIFAGETVQFTAVAEGDTPFSYTWSISGEVLPLDQSSVSQLFQTTGMHTVAVTVSNACGSDWQTKPVTVIEPPGLQPDLSLSRKLVNLAQIADSDMLTYTLVLRNSASITATATLTDSLPAQLTYIVGSATTSSGHITYTAGTMYWHGEIISGTPAVLTFAATVNTDGLDVGDELVNTAALDDGAGNVKVFTAVSRYNPGYSLSINDGALYTNEIAVSLALSWAVEEPSITQMFISNDGGFGSGTGWIPVNAAYSGWMLESHGDFRVTRTVYAKFRDSNGAQYGPVQDDIIYDPVAPPAPLVEILTDAGLAAGTPQGQSVIVRVTTSDDNSGIGQIQISHWADFDQYQSFAPAGWRTEIPWEMHSSGQLFTRVVDRAGNFSEATAQVFAPEHKVYLPTIMR
jgi:uncharacterized repeat protein (TIGR01451 family)